MQKCKLTSYPNTVLNVNHSRKEDRGIAVISVMHDLVECHMQGHM